jgi:hypothetical protein
MCSCNELECRTNLFLALFGPGRDSVRRRADGEGQCSSTRHGYSTDKEADYGELEIIAGASVVGRWDD